MPLQVKSSSHTTKFANIGKRLVLRDILTEYQKDVNFYIDYAWTTKIDWNTSILDVQNGRYDVPSFISIKGIKRSDTGLSGKLLKCASGQALGIIKSVLRKITKTQFLLNKAIEAGNLKKSDTLQTSLDHLKKTLKKPTFDGKSMTLDANVVTWIPCNDDGVCFEEFDGMLQITSLSRTPYKTNPCIPIKFHRHSRKLIAAGYSHKTIWIIEEDKVSSLWEREVPKIRKQGKRLGCDQGAASCITLSDGQTTAMDAHGHTLSSIMSKLIRKKKGSKAFRQVQEHRKNHIHWAINNLDLSTVNEIAYENVKDIRRGKKNVSSFLKGWTYPLIASKMEDKCRDEGVLLTLQSSYYRSQRCNLCGYTQKDNRQKKVFKCQHCNHEIDADLNGALNHESMLPEIPSIVFDMKLGHSNGFFWNPNGCYNLQGQALTVPVANKT